MSSKIDIANSALGMLGEGSISSFSDDSDVARICAQLYPRTRDMLLTMHRWRFCTAKVQLAQLVATPANEWKYGYQLPSDMLAGPDAVFNTTAIGATPFQRWEIFQNQLYTDDPVIVIDYRYQPDESKFPAWFVALCELAFASVIAPQVTDSAALAKLYKEEAFGTAQDSMKGGYFAVATAINDQGNQGQQFNTNAFINARFS